MGDLKLTSSAFSDGGEIPRKYGYNNGNISPPLTIENIPFPAKTLTLIMDDPDAMNVEINGEKPFKDPYVHWVVYNISAFKDLSSGDKPGRKIEIPESSASVSPITLTDWEEQTATTERFNEFLVKSYGSAFCMLGINGWKEFAYGGPAPPSGIDFPVRHKYFFRLFALRIGSYQEYAQIPKPSFGEQQAKKDKGRPLLLTAESVKMAIKNHIIEEATLTGTYQTDEEFAKTNSSPKS